MPAQKPIVNTIAHSGNRVRPIAEIIVHCLSDEQCMCGWDTNYCDLYQDWAVEKAQEIVSLKGR